MWLYVSIDFILWKLFFAWAILNAISVVFDQHLILKYPSIWTYPLLEIIPNDKDVDLWTLFILTEDHYFCLFAF